MHLGNPAFLLLCLDNQASSLRLYHRQVSTGIRDPRRQLNRAGLLQTARMAQMHRS